MDCSNRPKHDRILLKMLLISTHSCWANYSHCLLIDTYMVSRVPEHFTIFNIILFTCFWGTCLHHHLLLSFIHPGMTEGPGGWQPLTILSTVVFPLEQHSYHQLYPSLDMEFKIPPSMEGDRKHQRSIILMWRWGASSGLNSDVFMGGEPRDKHPTLWNHYDAMGAWPYASWHHVWW